MYQPFGFYSEAGAGEITEGRFFNVDAADYAGSGDIIDGDGNLTFSQVGSIFYNAGDDGYWESNDNGDYATGSNADHILPTSSNATFTVEWLFYPTAVNARFGALFNRWGNSASTNQSWWFGHANSNSRIHVTMRDGSSNLNYFSPNNSILQDEWNHNIFACELGGGMDVYRNGTKIDTDDLTSIVQLDRTGTTGTGAFASLWKQSQLGSSNTAQGRLASIRVYDFKFDQDDVDTQLAYFQGRGYSIT